MDLQGAWPGALLNCATGSSACRGTCPTQRDELNQTIEPKLHCLKLHDSPKQQIMRCPWQRTVWSQGRQQQITRQPRRITKLPWKIQRRPMQWHHQRQASQTSTHEMKCWGAGEARNQTQNYQNQNQPAAVALQGGTPRTLKRGSHRRPGG